MDKAKYIDDYLSGNLPKGSEGKFFADVAADAELRDELRLQTELRDALNADASDVYVPAETTAQIFSAMGFSAPGSKKRPLLWFARTRSAKVAASIIALILSAYGIYSLQNFTLDTPAKPQKAEYPLVSSIENYALSDAKRTEISLNSADKSNIFAARTTSNAVISPTETLKTETFPASDDENLSSNDHLANSGATYSAESTSEVAPELASDEPASAPHLLHNSQLPLSNFRNEENTNSKFPTLAAYTPSFKERDDSMFEISWSKIGNSNMKTLDIPNDNSSFFHDCNLSVLYKVSEDHAIGVEFGEENFYQEFTYNTFGQTASYEQKPNYFFYGVTYKYSPSALRIANTLQPFAQISAGGTKGGPVAKAALGLKLRISPSINAFVSGTYGGIFYNINSDYYFGDKAGLLWGFSLNI